VRDGAPGLYRVSAMMDDGSEIVEEYNTVICTHAHRQRTSCLSRSQCIVSVFRSCLRLLLCSHNDITLLILHLSLITRATDSSGHAWSSCFSRVCLVWQF